MQMSFSITTGTTHFDVLCYEITILRFQFLFNYNRDPHSTDENEESWIFFISDKKNSYCFNFRINNMEIVR